MPDRGWGAFLLAPLAVAGAALAFARGGRERRFLALVFAFTATSMAVVALFFGYARLALLVLPLWLILAAVAIVKLAGRLPPRLAMRVGAAAVVLLLAAEIYGAKRGHRLEASGTTLGGSPMLDRDQPIRFRPLPPR